MIMKAFAVVLLAAWLGLAAPPPDLDAPDDGQAHFPALQTTIRDPQVDQGPMLRCSVLDGKRMCDEDLGEAWCRKQGFGGGFVDWSTAPPIEKAQCADLRACTIVKTITCKGVPIMGD
ncbi:MAG TPA: hypothetical protein VGL66_13230 [Caulobacteraceae bacterium]|jgi:hypothetical protein